MIRLAKFPDIPKICEFAKRYKEHKKLFSDCEFFTTDFKQFLFECIATKGIQVFISDIRGEVRGFLIMSVDRVPWNKKKKWASDILFAAEREQKQLVDVGRKWAKKHNCWKTFFSNSTGQESADKFLEYCGGNRVGGQYEFCEESS